MAVVAMPGSKVRRRTLFAVQALLSVGANFLAVCIFFYMRHRFGWEVWQNLLLACGQGMVYVVGALMANVMAARLGRRRSLMLICLGTMLIALQAMVSRSAWGMAVAVLLYTLVSAAAWPFLESLVSADAGPHELSRRLGIYNLVWSGAGAGVMAVNGTVMDYWPSGLFLIPLLAHVAGWFLTLLMQGNHAGAAPSAAVHPPAEPKLLAKRTLALWLSRIALPATYVVIYSLLAMLPSLPVLEPLDTAWRTAVSSVWMIARVATFAVLGATLWWHTRPLVLLGAAVLMLVAFLGVTVQPSALTGLRLHAGLEIGWMIAWQVVLGVVLGVIYCGSLYFGMVLSEGSTEHGGYHEALIGLGCALGPGAGAIAQWIWPGNLLAGILAVAAVIGASVGAAGVACQAARRGGG
jgi:MFS family permease